MITSFAFLKFVFSTSARIVPKEKLDERRKSKETGGNNCDDNLRDEHGEFSKVPRMTLVFAHDSDNRYYHMKMLTQRQPVAIHLWLRIYGLYIYVFPDRTKF